MRPRGLRHVRADFYEASAHIILKPRADALKRKATLEHLVRSRSLLIFLNFWCWQIDELVSQYSHMKMQWEFFRREYVR
eukprot:6184322-Pleurochrysis_carterae.AAC.1